MNIVTPRFRANFGRYLLQCGLAVLTMLVVLGFLDLLSHAAIVASLGASAFLVFAMPNTVCARGRGLVGGYAISIATGVLFHRLSQVPALDSLALGGQPERAILGALAVGVAMLVMTATASEHPPAAGVSLGLVLNEWDIRTIAFILAAAIVLSLVKYVLRTVLIDLVVSDSTECSL